MGGIYPNFEDNRELNVKPNAFFSRYSLEIYNIVLESAHVPHTNMHSPRLKTYIMSLKIENKNLYWKINKFKNKDQRTRCDRDNRRVRKTRISYRELTHLMRFL